MSSASYKSVVEMFRDRVSSTPDGQAMLFKRSGEWTHINWRDTGDRVKNVACGLRALGLDNECAEIIGKRGITQIVIGAEHILGAIWPGAIFRYEIQILPPLLIIRVPMLMKRRRYIRPNANAGDYVSSY